MPIAEIGAAVGKAVEVAAEVAEKTAEVAAKAAEAAEATEVTGKLSEIKATGISLEEAKGFVDSKVKGFDEIKGQQGGRFADLKNDIDPETKINKTEKHHMPPDSVTKLDRDDGPAIKMDKEDHRKTASCGNSKEAREYNAKQKELIDQGKFREALQNDIDDIRSKFGDKYDEAISQMMEYVDKLEAEGKI